MKHRTLVICCRWFDRLSATGSASALRRWLSIGVLFAQILFLPAWGVAESPLPEGAKALRDQSYVTNGQARQKLDLYLPAAPKGPVLVWIHGGGWCSQTKSQVEGLAMLGQGYTVASLEYRFSQDAPFPAQIEDCKAAIRWLRAHAKQYGYDPGRIGAWGASAGGHLTALLATTGTIREFDVGDNLDQSSAIQCGVDFFGPTDFPDWKAPSETPLIQRTGAESVIVKLLGGPIDEKIDVARRASPVTWASKLSAPLYILHGTKDPLVGLEQSQHLADKLKASGVEVTLDVIEGGAHGGPQFWADNRPQRLVEFFNRHLLPK